MAGSRRKTTTIKNKKTGVNPQKTQQKPTKKTTGTTQNTQKLGVNKQKSTVTPKNTQKFGVNKQNTPTRRKQMTEQAQKTAQDNLKKTTNTMKNLTKGNLKTISGSHETTFHSIRNPNEEMYARAEEFKRQRGDYDNQKKSPYSDGQYSQLLKQERNNKEQREKNLKKASDKIDAGTKLIEKEKESMGKGGKFAADLYGAGLGLASDALAGPASMVSMFSRSYGSAYKTAKDEGASDSQAALYGASIGGLEAATEKMFAIAKPLQKIYGKGAADDLTEKVLEKMVQKASTQGDRDVVYHGGKTVMAAISEGLEEMVAEGLDPVLANQIYANALNVPHELATLEDYAYAFALGGAMGGLLGGGGQIVEYGKGKKISDTATEIYGEGGVNEVINKGLDIDEDAGGSLKAETYKEMITSGGIAMGQVAEMAREVEAQRVRDNNRFLDADNAANREIEKRNLDGIYEVDENGEVGLTANTQAAFNENLKANVDTIENMQLPEMNAQQVAEAVAAIQTGIATVEDVSLFTLKNPENRLAYETITGTKLPETNQETKSVLFEAVVGNRIKAAESQTAWRRDTVRGIVMQQVAADYGSAGQGAMGDTIEMADIDNATNTEMYITGFDNAYSAGRAGMDYSEYTNLFKGANENVPEDVLQAAHRAGLEDRVRASETAERVQLRLGQKVEKSRSNQSTGAQRGKLTVDLQPENKGRFGAQEQIFYKAIASVLNIEIRIVDNIKGNGMYVDGVVTMNIDGDRNLGYIFFHEITHHLQDYAPQEYQKLKEFLRTAWVKKDPEGYRAALDAKKAQYAEHSVNLNDEAALDEIIADGTYEFLQDESFIEELCNKERGVAQALLDAIRMLINKIRAILVNGDRFTPKQNEALFTELDILKEMESLWADALAQAVQNRAAVGTVSEMESVAKFSVREGMTEQQRYDELKDKNISVVEFNGEDISEKNIAELEEKSIGEARPLLRDLAKRLGVMGTYTNESVQIEFNFGSNNLNESIGKQKDLKIGDQFSNFAKMLACLKGVIQNAECIEVHRDDEGHNEAPNFLRAHVLVSAFKDGENIVPVKLLIKEFRGMDNVLYVTMTLTKIKEAELSGQRTTSESGDNSPHSTSIYSLSEILPKINDNALKKYIPSQFYENNKLKIDTEYMKAVENGDMETAQRMVDEAAEAAMKHSEIRDNKGKLLKVYHGTNAKFNSFNDPNHTPYGEQGNFYFSPWRSKSEEYGDNVRAFYLNIEVPRLYDENFDELNPDAEGIDGFIFIPEDIENDIDQSKQGDTEIVAYYPDQIKSADPVTYDDNGNVIPLSERFNSQNNDVRYSLPDTDSTGRELSAGQQSYFAKSQARNENGNLVVVYHASPTAGYEVFEGSKGKGNYRFSKYGEGITFFTDSKKMSDSYLPADEGGQYEGYVNIENPLIVDAEGRMWDVVSRDFSQAVYDRYISLSQEEKDALTDIAEWEDYGIFKDGLREAYENAQSDDDVNGDTRALASVYEDIVLVNGEEVLRNLSRLYDVTVEEFSEDAINWASYVANTTNDVVKKALEDGSYDGVIIKNVVDYGSHISSSGELSPGTDYIIFNSNQFKPVNNENPTKDPNIRFSLQESDEIGATESGSVVRYSLKSWSDTDKAKIKDNLVNAGFSENEAQGWIDDVNSVSAIIARDRDRLDYVAADNQVMLKDNAEYYKTLDASTLCSKRLLYQGTYNAIQRAMPNTPLLADDVIRIRQMMDEAGHEVPCGICYVESRRKSLGKYASQWLESYKGEYIPTLAQVTTTDGLEQLRKEHPQTHEDFIKAMNKKGVSNPKVVELRTDYRGEVQKLTKSMIKKITHIGGLRVQSFSDFETPHLIDMMQAVIDMAGKKLTAQAYTKVPNFAWVFGGTGIKINLSLIGDVDENGNLTFDGKEGMPIEEAMAIRERYPENVGTILVGKSREHILAAMADPRIDFIIPFHHSGWAGAQYEALGLKGYKTFQSEQTEKLVKGGKPEDGDLYYNDYWDYSKTGKENAERYLEMCKEQGRVPVFSSFLVDNGDGSWSLQPDGSTDGYWKLLIDFKMYDNDGNGVPQTEVKPNFNMEEARRVLAEYDGDSNSLPVADDIVERFVDEYKGNNPRTRYSLQDSKGRELSEGQQEYFRNSKARDEDGDLQVVYHGTPAGEFYTFDKAKGSVEGDFGSGFYFSDSEDDMSANYEGGGPDFDNKVARRAEQIEAYEDIDYDEAEKRARQELYVGENRFEVYLNIENPAIVGETYLLSDESFYENYDPEDFDSEEEYQEQIDQDIYDTVDSIILDVERNVDLFSTDGISEVLWDAIYSGGIGIEELKAKINELYLESSTGDFVGNEVTRQIIESLGYDGIIDPTVSGKWNMDIPTGAKHYIVFNPNQIKYVDNLNPTENPDIRYSLPDSDDVYDYINSNETEFVDVPPTRDYEKEFARVKDQSVGELKKQVEKLQAQTKQTHGKVLDPKSISEEVNMLIKSLLAYNDGTKKTDHKLIRLVQENAKSIYADVKNGNIEDAAIRAWDVATEVIENLELINDEAYQEYKELRKYLKQTKINFPEGFPYRKEFRADNFGRLVLVNEGGRDVDDVYQELLGLYPGMFDETIDNEEDQLQEIADVRGSLEPYDIVLSEEETNQLIKETAHDILDIAVHGKPWKSWADRQAEIYDERTKKLKARHKEALRDVRAKMKEKADERVKAEKTKAKDKAEAEKMANARKQAEQKRAQQESKERKNAEAEKRRHITRIEKDLKWLSDRLLKPTDDKHLPDGYQKAIAELLIMVDPQTARSKKLEEKYGKSKKRLNFLKLKAEYENIAKNESEGVIYNEDISNWCEQLGQTLDDAGSIADATVEEMRVIRQLIRAIAHSIREQNNAFDENLKTGIAELATETIHKAKTSRKTGQRGGIPGALGTLLNESMVTPRDFFEGVGGGILKAFMSIRKGHDKHVDNMTEARTFFAELFGEYANKKKPGSEIENWRNHKTNETFKLEGGTITMNVAQKMALYCSLKRDQAAGHIFGSGIVVAEASTMSKLKEALGAKKEINYGTTRITMEEAYDIVSTLTSEQIEIADKLQEFLNGRCAEWGNETSLKMYGYKKFTEPNYFPIQSADVYLDSNFEGRQTVERIRNFGFTKGTVVNANNPIVIDDIFTVVADHVNKMSMYNSFAAPIADFTRVYNFRTRDEAGLVLESTKDTLANTYGKKVGRYINNFIADLQNNTQTRQEGFTRFVNKTLANYKKASIAANIRVALQQPTAIIRAFTLIDPKYFILKNHTPELLKKVKGEDTEYKDMLEHCPIARWKSWGFSQVDMARDIDDIMMNKEWSRLDLVTMQVYGVLDLYTWSKIWGAVRAEVKAKHPDVEVDSEEYYALCNERASEIFDKTQVVDSVVHKSQVMRNTDTMSKVLTSFMAEPTRTYNMVRSEYAQAMDMWADGDKVKATAKVARASSVYLLNALACAAAAAVADALRGKDLDGDDEEEEWYELTLSNFMSNANPLNLLPVFKEVSSIWKGWDTSNMALEGIEALVKAEKGLFDKMMGESDKPWSELIRKQAEAMGMVFGVPVKNILREVESFGKMVGIDVFAAEKGEEEKQLDLNLVKDGSGFDNFLNGVGINLSDKERMDRNFGRTVKSLNRATKNMTEKEKQEYLWKEITRGYTTDIEAGNYDSINNMRRLLKETGGDYEKFEESVLSKTKTALRKSIGGDSAKIRAYKEVLISEFGYTAGKISSEVLMGSETATEFQKALCTDDFDGAVEKLKELYNAGMTEADAYALFVNRSKAIKASDYTTGELTAPCNGEITSTFGYRNAPTAGASSNHKGIDIAVASNSDIAAADGGKVSSVGYNSGYGYYVKINHGNGRYTMYAHLNGYYVQKGQAVSKGDVIALSGSTGVSTGPHLHFEVIENGVNVDPLPYLQ